MTQAFYLVVWASSPRVINVRLIRESALLKGEAKGENRPLWIAGDAAIIAHTQRASKLKHKVCALLARNAANGTNIMRRYESRTSLCEATANNTPGRLGEGSVWMRQG